MESIPGDMRTSGYAKHVSFIEEPSNAENFSGSQIMELSGSDIISRKIFKIATHLGLVVDELPNERTSEISANHNYNIDMLQNVAFDVLKDVIASDETYVAIKVQILGTGNSLIRLMEHVSNNGEDTFYCDQVNYDLTGKRKEVRTESPIQIGEICMSDVD